MRKNSLIKLLIFVTAVTFVMASCKSNDDEKGAKEGYPTKISLSVTQPAKTYANDGNAKPSEVIIEFVDVFIYQGTTYAFEKYVRLSVAQDFTETAPGSNSYKLNSDKEIETTVGKKIIYIGANLPASMVDPLKLDAHSALTVPHISDLMASANGGFTMFTTHWTEANISHDSSNPSNNVAVSITRLLSKVAVIQGNTVNLNIPGGIIGNLQFAISNNNTKFYAIARKTSPAYNSYEDPNWTIGSAAGDLYKAAASDYVALNPETGFDPKRAQTVYTLENTSEGSLQNESTYVTVRGQFVPNEIVKLTTPGDGSSTLIPDVAITLGETFYTVAPAGKRSFFSKEQDALDYGATMLAQVTKYRDGWAYYSVFLNPTQPPFGQKYDVIRNCLFNVKVTEVRNLGAGEDVDGGNVPIVDPIDIAVDIDIEGWVDENIDTELD